MEQTNYLLQEILQEIREVKAHVIPAPNVGPAATFAQSSPTGSGSPIILGQKPLAQGWVSKPYEKGPKKGASRWYHEKNNSYTDKFPECNLEEVEDEEEAEVELASAGGVVLPTKKRLSKEDKAALSPEQKMALKEQKCAAAAIRKANRTPEEQAKIDERVAKMKAARMAKKSAAGGSAEERTRKRKIHRSRTRKA